MYSFDQCLHWGSLDFIIILDSVLFIKIHAYTQVAAFRANLDLVFAIVFKQLNTSTKLKHKAKKTKTKTKEISKSFLMDLQKKLVLFIV